MNNDDDNRVLENTVNVLYNVVSVYYIWREIVFEQVGVDMN